MATINAEQIVRYMATINAEQIVRYMATINAEHNIYAQIYGYNKC